MLTQCIALDHGPDGVRANCICPGWVRTPMADGEMDDLGLPSREAAYTVATKDVPLRRPSTPEEIAGTAGWLLSDDAASVTGAVISVDGGSTVVDVAALAFDGGERAQPPRGASPAEEPA
jgi:NAD(P)-dependent dehydrogenase (short-subunit alcohol dehydrogenase family)